MKFKTGDRVKFLNDTGEGVLVSFIGKDKALVKIEDGFDIPVMISELIHHGGDYFTDRKENQEDESDRRDEVKIPKSVISDQTGKKENKPVKAAGVKPDVPDEGIYFAVRKSLKHSGINTWLINSSSWKIKYLVSNPVDDGNILFSGGVLEADTKVYLRRYIPENINEPVIFDLQLLFYKDTVYKNREPAAIRIYVDSEGIFNGKDLRVNDYFEEKAAIYPVLDFRSRKWDRTDALDISKVLREKQDIPEPVKQEKIPDPAKQIIEVDLHIEQLADNFRELTNGEIVDIQMGRFRTALETAIIHKTPKIVFIHGVGNGKLKYELRRTLDRKFPDLRYQDASFREYGYGATMVLI